MIDALKHLTELVHGHIIDVRKVDKGQIILVIDYIQRKKAEEINISKIAKISDIQNSNWKENREFVETIMKRLYSSKFISKSELTAVTGLLAGGKDGKLTHVDGSMKYTRMLSNIESFCQQKTPYVYPLFKVHKMSIDELLQINPNHVATEIESRLVVGMSSCQLTRTQVWLEHLLTLLAIFYGKFEFIKDSNDFLIKLEEVKKIAAEERWDWSKYILFTVDVKALYPSVKFDKLVIALQHCFNKCTTWTTDIIDLLIELIIYTLKNQQIYWNMAYYDLNQGIPTGGKHSVPLANIFLSFIFIYSLDTDSQFKQLYVDNIKLWSRFIDDCCGIYKGNITEFKNWFSLLKICFQKYDLDLTCDTDSHTVSNGVVTEKESKKLTFLDLDIFKCDGTIHTTEHRKSTSADKYLVVTSAHPRHTFPGIVKSQLYRLRRLCSRDTDFKVAAKDLEVRCINSGYQSKMVNDILSSANSLSRNLAHVPSHPVKDNVVRLVTLAGSSYVHKFTDFASRMNRILSNSDIRIEVVRCTSSPISRLLFNNGDVISGSGDTVNDQCTACTNGIMNDTGYIKSNVTNRSFKVDTKLNCKNGGIYVADAACSAQYTGKTIHFGVRSREHFVQGSTAVSQHIQTCNRCNNVSDFKLTFVEDYLKRGKYSLLEREFLWNNRIRGSINTQKTLAS